MVERESFTPGPWSQDGDLIFAPSKGRRVGRVAIVSLGYKDSETYRANLNLIAAAPELYKTLESILAEDNPNLIELSNRLEAGRAALRKARGEPA